MKVSSLLKRTTAANAFTSYLTELDSDMCSYRLHFRRIFSRKLVLPRHCAQYFFGFLISTSRLYGDYLLLRQLEPNIPTEPSPENQCRTDVFRSDEEATIRKRLQVKVQSLPCWSRFNPTNAFAAENQLRTRADYAESVVLHLPEIYGETTKVRALMRKAPYSTVFSDSYVSELLVRLEHIAHHASYGRHALEELSREDNWSVHSQ